MHRSVHAKIGVALCGEMERMSGSGKPEDMQTRCLRHSLALTGHNSQVPQVPRLIPISIVIIVSPSLPLFLFHPPHSYRPGPLMKLDRCLCLSLKTSPGNNSGGHPSPPQSSQCRRHHTTSIFCGVGTPVPLRFYFIRVFLFYACIPNKHLFVLVSALPLIPSFTVPMY